MDGSPGQTESNSDAARAAAAAAVSPDAQTAEILAKHSAGLPLTPQESGKLSWVGRKFPWLNPRKNQPASGPAGAGAPGNPAPVGPVASAEASGNGMGAVPVDAALARRAASFVLKRADSICVNYIDRELRAVSEAGIAVPDKTANRFRSSAGISGDDKELLVDLSPDICEELGINPRNFALWTALGVAGLHATNLWMCVQELRALRGEKVAPAATPERAGTHGGWRTVDVDATKVVQFPNPPTPKGAPPNVT